MVWWTWRRLHLYVRSPSVDGWTRHCESTPKCFRDEFFSNNSKSYLQGIVLAIIYLIVALASIGATVNRPKIDFGPSDPVNKGISGMQECNMAGAASLSIISIIIAFLGAGIYVRRKRILCYLMCYQKLMESHNTFCRPFHIGIRSVRMQCEKASDGFDLLLSSRQVCIRSSSLV
jgi:hypothetical protein